MTMARSWIGEINFDIGPGELNRTAAVAWPGMEVGVFVALGVNVRVGIGSSVGISVGVNAIAVAVPELFADSAVSAITVGKYSGG